MSENLPPLPHPLDFTEEEKTLREHYIGSYFVTTREAQIFVSGMRAARAADLSAAVQAALEEQLNAAKVLKSATCPVCGAEAFGETVERAEAKIYAHLRDH